MSPPPRHDEFGARRNEKYGQWDITREIKSAISVASRNNRRETLIKARPAFRGFPLAAPPRELQLPGPIFAALINRHKNPRVNERRAAAYNAVRRQPTDFRGNVSKISFAGDATHNFAFRFYHGTPVTFQIQITWRELSPCSIQTEITTSFLTIQPDVLIKARVNGERRERSPRYRLNGFSGIERRP